MTIKRVLLHVASLCAGYGESIIIDDIGFSLAAGSSLALLGRNGVGKSTLFRTLLGHARQRSGVICFNDRDTTWPTADHVLPGLPKLTRLIGAKTRCHRRGARNQSRAMSWVVAARQPASSIADKTLSSSMM